MRSMEARRWFDHRIFGSLAFLVTFFSFAISGIGQTHCGAPQKGSKKRSVEVALPAIEPTLTTSLPREFSTALRASASAPETMDTGLLVSVLGSDAQWLCDDEKKSLTSLHSAAVERIRDPKSGELREKLRKDYEEPAQALLARALAQRDFQALASVALKYRFTAAGTNAFKLVLRYLLDRNDNVTASLFLRGFLRDQADNLCSKDNIKTGLVGAGVMAGAGLRTETESLLQQLSKCDSLSESERAEVVEKQKKLPSLEDSYAKEFEKSWREVPATSNRSAKPFNPLLKMALLYSGAELEHYGLFSSFSDSPGCLHLDFSEIAQHRYEPLILDRYPLIFLEVAKGQIFSTETSQTKNGWELMHLLESRAFAFAPQAITLLADEEHSYDAQRVLNRLNGTIPLLLPALHDKRMPAKVAVASVLGNAIGRAKKEENAIAGEALHQLLELAKSYSPEERLYFANALGNAGPRAKAAADWIAPLLDSEKEAHRLIALIALRKIRADHEKYLDQYLSQLSDENDGSPQLELVKAALEQIGEKVAPRLLDIIKDGNSSPIYRSRALSILNRLSKKYHETLPFALQLASSPIMDDRLLALATVSKLGINNPDTVKTLEKMLNDDSTRIQIAAIDAVSNLKITDLRFTEILLSKYREGKQNASLHPATRQDITTSVLNALAGMGEAAAPISSELVAELESATLSFDRRLLVRALVSSGEKGTSALIAFIKDTESRSTKLDIVRALRTTGKQNAAFVPSLITTGTTPPPIPPPKGEIDPLISESIEAIVGIGPQAIPLLIDEVRTGSPERKVFAINVLVRFPQKTLRQLPGKTLEALKELVPGWANRKRY
jgi:hypothetical protein